MKILEKLNNRLLWLTTYVPREPYVKLQWRAYRTIIKKHLGYSFDLSSLKPFNYKENTDANIIWIYWNNGIDNAPVIVKKCYESVLHNLQGDYRAVLLTADNINEYVNIPGYLYEKRKRGIFAEAHFSDFLRISLLYLYGGIWLDATCLLSSSIPSYVNESELFLFQTNKLQETVSPIVCSNWFIKANKENYILGRLIQQLLGYWQQNDKLIHYYQFHLTLSAIVKTDTKAAAMWENIPYVCNMNPHVMLFSLSHDYSDFSWTHISNSCFVHKLTYKYDKTWESVSKKNILQHILYRN